MALAVAALPGFVQALRRRRGKRLSQVAAPAVTAAAVDPEPAGVLGPRRVAELGRPAVATPIPAAAIMLAGPAAVVLALDSRLAPPSRTSSATAKRPETASGPATLRFYDEHSRELGLDGLDWKWLGDAAVRSLRTPHGAPRDVAFNALSPGHARRVTLIGKGAGAISHAWPSDRGRNAWVP